MIATVSQVVHRIDDRQSGSDVRFEQELDATVAGRFFQFDIIAVRIRAYLSFDNDSYVTNMEEFVW